MKAKRLVPLVTRIKGDIITRTIDTDKEGNISEGVYTRPDMECESNREKYGFINYSNLINGTPTR